ncbi:MAG: thiamine phosphate synthase [bacterium]
MIHQEEKNNRLYDRHLYLITPPSYKDKETLIDQLVAGISGGADMIQLRDKRTNIKELIGLAQEIADIAKRHDVLFIINDSIGLAMASNADGVHLGQDDTPLNLARSILGPEKIIGCSTHSIKQAINAEKLGADYIGIGPIFYSPLKKDLSPIGPYMLRELSHSISIPYFALGGINLDNLDEVIHYGGERVALCSAFFEEPDLIKTATLIKEKLIGPGKKADEEAPA